MRNFVVSVIVLSCLAVPVLAIAPSPYIGANLQVNSPTGKFSQTDIVDKDGGAKTGLGGEIDAGITGNSGSIYVGYRFSKHNADATYPTPNGPASVTGDWNINRAVIGLRWHILGDTQLPLVPTLGGGITIGKTKASVSGMADTLSYKADETSKTGVGWFVELGGLLKPPGPLNIIGDIQYHSFDSDFSTQLYNGKVNISFFTFQLGVQYLFGAPMSL